MTLNININIDNPDLLQKNKEQANANREINLIDKNDRTETEEKAQQKRELSLEQQGLDADGKISKKGRPPETYYPAKPAANRSGGYVPAVGFYALTDDTLSVYSQNGTAVITKVLSKLPEQEFELKWDLPEYNSSITTEMDWGSSGSPEENGFSSIPYTGILCPLEFGDPTGRCAYAATAPSGSFTYTFTRADFETFAHDELLCLPLNSSTFFLYFVSVRHKVGYYYGVKTQYTTNIESVGIVEMGDYLFGYEGPGEIFAAKDTSEVIDLFYEEYNQRVRNEFCFLISNNSVEEVSVPDALSGAMAKLYPALSFFSSLPIESEQIYVSENKNTLLSVGDPPDLVETATTVEPVYINRINLSEFYNTMRDSMPQVDLGLLTSFGLGALQTSNHIPNDPLASSLRRSYSPAVFSLLENAESISNYDYDFDLQFRTYKYIYDNFLTESPFRGIYLDYRSLGYRYMLGLPRTIDGLEIDQPLNTYTSVPEESFRRNLLKNKKVIDNATVIYCWNWNNAAYCREKLLQFGLSSQEPPS